MILGLDISTSITGVTVLDGDGNIVHNDAWDTRKYKNFFKKVEYVEQRLTELCNNCDGIERIYIEQSLQSFRSGFSSAKTLSTLAAWTADDFDLVFTSSVMAVKNIWVMGSSDLAGSVLLKLSADLDFQNLSSNFREDSLIFLNILYLSKINAQE